MRKDKIAKVVRDLGSVRRTTRAMQNQQVFDGGNIAPFVTQPRPGNQ